jgi:hypothetical protein
MVWEPKRRLWAEAGIPVMGSKRDLKCEMVHDGETRRSEDALEEVMIRGMSAAVVVDAMT